ncbi:MAG: hypothetical protein AAGA54_26265 [Myxococcota bacterium]
MSTPDRPPLRRPPWVVALASTLTLAYVAALVLLVVSFALDREPTGMPPGALYGSAFVLMVACSFVAPSRGSGANKTHLHRAPSWMKALVGAHGVGLVALLGLVAAGTDVSFWASSLVLATFFGSVGVLMGWYGQFRARE